MASTLLKNSIFLAQFLVCCSLIAGAPDEIPEAASTLVRVNIITEIYGAKDTVKLNGKLIANYSPIIVQDYSSIGLVLDQQGHIMTFLGYLPIDIQNRDTRVEISNTRGQRWKGKLIGIDQHNGVAVVRILRGKLPKTPVCAKCEVVDGTTIVVPLIENRGPSQYQKAQILSVGEVSGIREQAEMVLRVSHPFPGIGQPILTADHRVLGFIADWDPINMQTIVAPIAPLLDSAAEILKAGGDIRIGWLGIYLEDSQPVVVQRVVPDSPAHKAKLNTGDSLRTYNGQEIRDAVQFIQLVENSPIGSKAKIEVVRQGNPLTVAALIEARKPQQDPGPLSFNLPRPVIGLDTLVITPSLAEALQLPGQTGLLVVEVTKQMPAEKAGILVGDIIVAMDGQPVFDPASFVSYWQTHGLGEQLVLKILRKGTERSITVRIPD